MKRLQKQNGNNAVQNSARALIKCLNDSDSADKTFVTGLVRDAKDVVERLGAYSSLREFCHSNEPQNEEFWKAYGRLNDTLREFLHAPQVDVNVFYDGEPVSSMLAADDLSVVTRDSMQIRWVLRLIERGSLWRVRSCEYCRTWYVARTSTQRFCSRKNCRWNAYATDPIFKEKRRSSARELYQLHLSGKVVTKTGK